MAGRRSRPAGEVGYWSGHPASTLLEEQTAARTDEALLSASGFGLTRTRGACMWPGIREGDLLLFRPLPPGAPLLPWIGQVAVARDGARIVAHRLRRVIGFPGRERFVLAGDLAIPDPPRPRSALVGMVRTIYRPGTGFLDPPPVVDLGPIARAVVVRLARLATRAVSSG